MNGVLSLNVTVSAGLRTGRRSNGCYEKKKRLNVITGLPTMSYHFWISRFLSLSLTKKFSQESWLSGE